MLFCEINNKNIDQYKDFFDESTLENLDRDCCYFVALHSGEGKPPQGVISWEMFPTDNEDIVEGELLSLAATTQKAGKALLAEYETQARETGIEKTYFEFPVAEESDDFTEKVLTDAGFTVRESESVYVTVKVDEIRELLFMSPQFEDSRVKSLGELSIPEFRIGVRNCIYGNHRGLLYDLSSLPFGYYEMNVSCAVESDGDVKGLFLVHRLPSGKFIAKLLYASGKRSQVELLQMLHFAGQKMIDTYSGDTEIMIHIRDNKRRDLVKKLIPNARGNEVKVGVKEE